MSALLDVDDVGIGEVLLLVVLYLDVVRAKEAELVIVLHDLYLTGKHAFQTHPLTLSVTHLDPSGLYPSIAVY